MTPFEKKVYSVVKYIPRGRVLTYAEVARKTGRPFSYRAVGNALNKNHNLQVPCHRVICSDGLVGGFNQGIESKIKLLKREGLKIWNKKISLK